MLGEEFERYCATAAQFWPRNTLPAGDATILVELMTEDVRVSIRNLTVANAIRRFIPARIVVFTGVDEDWSEILWTYYDKPGLERLALAYGAEDMIDIHDIVDARLGDKPPKDLHVAGRTIPGSVQSAIEPEILANLVRATVARILRVPRLTAEIEASAKYERICRRSQEFSHVYDALMAGLNPVAVVSSHVDYNHWGLAVESALRFDVPAVHVQSTGGLKAYTLFPETRVGEGSFRMHMTRQIAEFFEQHLWANRDVLRRSAELTAWRSKSNLGRPSWWRGGGVVSSVEFRTPQERESIRRHAMARLGFDPSKQVVAVYNHATSDALNTNVEVFEDLGRWFEETAAFAVGEPSVNWLFVDHPSQAKYDLTGFFDQVKARHADARHLVFLPSLELSKNVMWSLVDLGVTVRGSVSNELPVYGIPAIQAGWSEWSGCGFTSVARDVDDYWRLLREAIAGLVVGRPLITAEQIERARLWLWFYRSGGDVASHLVQHWELGQNEELFNALAVAMRQVESDGDAAFVSTQRMWSRKEPFLTRFDFARGSESLAEQLGSVREL